MFSYLPYGKRILDVTICLVSAPVALPTIGIIVFISKIKGQDRLLYKQQRPGLNGKLFSLYKISTLSDTTHKNGKPLTDLERQTPWGKLLRDYSLDELPQWYNILKGDMSWVGPRPLLPEYLPHYTPRQQKRHQVKPGLSGLAQINGRNQLSWNRKLACDTVYVEKQSFKLDCYIILKTVLRIWQRQEVNYGDKQLVGPQGQPKAV